MVVTFNRSRKEYSCDFFNKYIGCVIKICHIRFAKICNIKNRQEIHVYMHPLVLTAKDVALHVIDSIFKEAGWSTK